MMCEFDVGSQVRFGTSRPQGPVWPGPGAGAEAGPWTVLLRSHGPCDRGHGSVPPGGSSRRRLLSGKENLVHGVASVRCCSWQPVGTRSSRRCPQWCLERGIKEVSPFSALLNGFSSSVSDSMCHGQDTRKIYCLSLREKARENKSL